MTQSGNGYILEVENLTKSFASRRVLSNVGFSMKKGEVISIIGSSGGGKSTLLRCLAFLEKIDSGKIVIDGETAVDIAPDAKKAKYPKTEELKSKALKLGLVFQDFNLFPHLSVIKNLTLPLTLVKKEKADAAQKIALFYLEQVGLAGRKDAYVCELSGGMKQRVAIARAMCMQPEILCFDEPTSALDPELTGEVLKVIRSVKDTGVSMLIVTHEIMFAREISDQVIFLDGGSILESGDAKSVIDNPQKERTKAFMEKIMQK